MVRRGSGGSRRAVNASSDSWPRGAGKPIKRLLGPTKDDGIIVIIEKLDSTD